MERFLPFGLRTSPFLFDIFAKCLNWMMINCSDLGLKINDKKNRQCTVVEFLGIELDTHLMQARLPAEKLQKANDLVQTTLNKSTITRNKLDTLAKISRLCSQSAGAGKNFSPTPFQLQNRARAPIYVYQFSHKS